MNCKKCGYELERDTKFCPNCGQEVDRKACQYCGQALDDDTKFCTNCGKAVVEETSKVVCATCGQVLEEGTVFCFNCGNKVVKEDMSEPVSVSETNTEETKEPETTVIPEPDETKVETEQINTQPSIEIPPVQPIQNTVPEKKSFWKNPILWIVSISLLIICLLISLYFRSLPTKKTNANSTNKSNITEKEDKEVKDVSTLKIKGTNSTFVNQTNANIGGYTYVFDNKLYVSTSTGIYRYDLDYSNEEKMLEDSGTYLYVDQEYIYYCDYINDYIRYNVKTQESEVLLEDVYYVQVIDRTIYYQSNQDNESIYVYNLDGGENTKLNDVPSYTITIDANNNSIYYIDEDSSLNRMYMDGSGNEALLENVTDYTFYEGSLYCVNDKGIEKYDMSSKKSKMILKKKSIKNINILDNRIVYSVFYDGIYSVNLKGENRKMLVDQKVSSFEVQGDKIIFDCNNDYAYQVVDNKGNYGELPISSGNILDEYDYFGDEDEDIGGAHSF